MVEEGPVIGRELSTLSTPSTVETTVEASGTLTTAREREQEGCGGKEGKPPEPIGPLEPSWARALHSHAACALGRCAYANPEQRPNRYVGANGCDGYHASRTTDTDGRVTVRWGLCPRHREWWRHEQRRKRAAAVPKPGPHPGLGPER
jgi:hypothetical protein